VFPEGVVGEVPEQQLGEGKCHLTYLEMAMGTRNPMGFYPIRVWVWVNLHTHGFINGHKSIPDGFMGMGLVL
jgi:hypothetical protein